MKKIVKTLRSRELRKNETEVEKLLWRFLRNRHLTGMKFRRQYVFKGFILDFYCAEQKVAIELDGSVHDKQKAYDVAHQAFIESHGIKVIRFKNKMVINNINSVLKLIKEAFPSPLNFASRQAGMEKGEG